MPIGSDRCAVRRRRRRTGFTLIELISVVVILTVVSAVVVPSLSSLQGTRGAQAAKTLLRDVTWARQYALATGTGTWVVFDTANETWSLLAEDPNNPGRANAAVLTDAATGQNWVATLGEFAFTGQSISSADFDSGTELGFDWRGRPKNASETDLAALGTVTLRYGQRVEVLPETGHARLVIP